MGDRSRIWLITGVSTGFGRELAKAVLARGEIVAGTVRQGAQVDEFRGLAAGRSFAYRLDVTEANAIIQAVDSDAPPMRLVLCADALGAGRAKLASLAQNYDAWEKVSSSTNAT